MQGDRLIVGIDFGTTYSGVAWCYTGDPDELIMVDHWPGENGVMKKVPTLLAYSKREPSKYKWGAQVKSDISYPVSWFKLLLEESTPEGEIEESAATMLAGLSLRNIAANAHAENEIRSSVENTPEGKSPVDLVADYLKGLHEHTLSVLRATYNSSQTEKIFDRNPVKYYLTVPAGWSDKAKALTLQAAKMAGILEEGKSEVTLMSEPEAAASHCFKAFQATDDPLKVGEVYVVADCGGGTVDLISYEITATEPYLKVKECVTGTHGFCGATSLNSRFQELVEQRLGTEVYDEMSPLARWNTLNYFDKFLKTTFNPHENEDDDVIFHVPVPGVPNDQLRGIYGGFLVLSTDEMKSVFEPTFQAISKLVQDQISSARERSGKGITGVLLVGGFGCSEYLLRYLSTSVKQPNGDNIRILRPQDAWVAVVRGAVLSGVANHNASSMVESRIARFSYGVNTLEPFRFGVHPLKKLYFHEMPGAWYCLDRMSWFVKKGDEIPDGKPLEIPVHLVTYVGEENDKLQKIIYCSKSRTPPSDSEHEDVQELLDFTLELPEYKEGEYMEKKISPHDQRPYWDVSITSVMRYGAGELLFSAEVGGQQVGKLNTNYHHEVPSSS